MARGKRDTRFATLRTFFSSHQAGLMDLDVCKANVKMIGYLIYESELEKFGVENPDIDLEAFTAWLQECEALKSPGGKKGTGTPGAGRGLNTAEKAEQVGVAPENIEKYIALVNQLFAIKDELQSIVPLGTISLAIPIRKKKENTKAETVTQ